MVKTFAKTWSKYHYTLPNVNDFATSLIEYQCSPINWWVKLSGITQNRIIQQGTLWHIAILTLISRFYLSKGECWFVNDKLNIFSLCCLFSYCKLQFVNCRNLFHSIQESAWLEQQMMVCMNKDIKLKCCLLIYQINYKKVYRRGL